MLTVGKKSDSCASSSARYQKEKARSVENLRGFVLSPLSPRATSSSQVRRSSYFGAASPIASSSTAIQLCRHLVAQTLHPGRILKFPHLHRKISSPSGNLAGGPHWPPRFPGSPALRTSPPAIPPRHAFRRQCGCHCGSCVGAGAGGRRTQLHGTMFKYGPGLSRSMTDIVNVVEQRIWHSMEEGHVKNLPGKGKPLNLISNPQVD